jgi:microcystin-dependent protein
MWPTSSPPTGWLLCNGQAVSRTTYAGLFAVVGTIFGVGNGSSTFNLPDYRDRMPVGAGTTFGANTAGGSKDAVVVSHTHAVTDPGHLHSDAYYISSYSGGGYGQNFKVQSATTWPNGVSTVASNTGTAATGISIQTSGVSETNANMPPYLGIYFIIKA